MVYVVGAALLLLALIAGLVAMLIAISDLENDLRQP